MINFDYILDSKRSDLDDCGHLKNNVDNEVALTDCGQCKHDIEENILVVSHLVH